MQKTAPPQFSSVPLKLVRLLDLREGEHVFLSQDAPANWAGEFRNSGLLVSADASFVFSLFVEFSPRIGREILASADFDVLLSDCGKALLQISDARSKWKLRWHKLRAKIGVAKSHEVLVAKLAPQSQPVFHLPLAVSTSLMHPQQIDVLPFTVNDDVLKVHIDRRYSTSQIVLLASKQKPPFHGLLKEIESLAPDLLVNMAVSQAMLRDRGALIVTLTTLNQGKYISRLCCDHEIAAYVRENAGILLRLHENPMLSDFCRERIPKLIAQTHDIFVEQMIPGELAWKVVLHNHSVESQVLDHAWRFSLDLCVATSFQAVIDDALFLRLIGDETRYLRECKEVDSELSLALQQTDTYLRSRLCSKPAWIACGHGDYGYGNLICDANTGNLRGVIDWDTFRCVDLPGVDFFNLTIQRFRRQRSLIEAFQMALNWMSSNQHRGSAISRQLNVTFGADCRVIIPVVAALHLVGRDMRYRPLSPIPREEREMLLSLPALFAAFASS
jgi:hypothetical protein